MRACSRPQKRSASSRFASTKMNRLATHASWLSTMTSLAARSAARSSASSEATASRPTIEIDVLGSNDTSWKPGPRYLTTLLIASPPPQATILSKY